MSPRAPGDPTEAQHQAAVIGLARYHGWRVFHAPDNRPSGKTGRPQRLAAPEARGFPDLVLVRGPRLIFAELKTDTGRLGPGQQEWLDALNAVGDEVASLAVISHPDAVPQVIAVVWRPRDWPLIEAILGSRTSPPYQPPGDPHA